MIARVTAVLFLLLLPAGCRPKGPAGARADSTEPLPATTAPAEAGVFASAQHGFRLTYPPEWEPVPSAEFVLSLQLRGAGGVDTNEAGTTFAAAISVDVPKLPPHIPGWIPLGLVVNGYVDDLKERYADLRLEESAPTKLAGANARRVRSTWTIDGRPQVEDAVLTARGDRVYIFRLTADSRDYARALAVYESVLRSVTWET